MKKKLIAAAVAAMMMAMSSVNVFAWRASQVRVDLEPVADYSFTQGNSLGEWSFYETAGYWPVSKVVRNQGYLVPGTTDEWVTVPGINHDSYKYGDTADTSYFKPMTKIYPAGRSYAYYPLTDNFSGVIVSGNGSAADYAPIINIRTNASDGLNEFALNGAKSTDDNTADVIVCFNVPEDGDYDVSHEFMNRGKGLGYGDALLRRTIIRVGESTFESAENSVDWAFGRFETEGQAAPKAVGTMSDSFKKGDKIYFRVSCLLDSWNDAIFGNVKVTKKDDLGNVEKVYNLNDLTMSQTEQWRYYTSGKNENETNPDNFYRLHVKPNHAKDYEFPDTTDGVNGVEKMTAASVYWTLAGGSAISFNRRDISYPFIEWFYDETDGYNKYENGVYAVMQKSPSLVNNGYLAKDYRMIIGWVAPKDGFYKVGYEYAKHTSNPGSDTDGDAKDTKLEVKLYETGKTAATLDIDSRYIPNDTNKTAVMDYMPIIPMKAGDRIMYEISCEDNYSGNRVVQLTPVVTEAETVTSYYNVDGTDITIASSYTDYAYEINENKDMQFIYSVLDDSGKMVAAYLSDTFNLSEMNPDGYNWSGHVEKTYKLPAEGKYSVITYIWDDVNSMTPVYHKIRSISGDN